MLGWGGDLHYLFAQATLSSSEISVAYGTAAFPFKSVGFVTGETWVRIPPGTRTRNLAGRRAPASQSESTMKVRWRIIRQPVAIGRGGGLLKRGALEYNPPAAGSLSEPVSCRVLSYRM